MIGSPRSLVAHYAGVGGQEVAEDPAPVLTGRGAQGAIEPRFRALILTAGYCGLRAGELSALKVSGVDFLRRKLTVAESHSEVRGRLVTKSTKTRRRREVPVPKALIDVLADHVKRYPSADGFVFSPPRVARSVTATSTGGATSQPWRRPAFRQTYGSTISGTRRRPS